MPPPKQPQILFVVEEDISIQKSSTGFSLSLLDDFEAKQVHQQAVKPGAHASNEFASQFMFIQKAKPKKG